MATETKTHDDYTVGWVCALPKERAAATAMLDQIHGNLPKPKGDSNTYTLGSIGKHNVVIACLPKGQYGNNPAATVATQMIRTFQSIKLGLMVGIGGGIPLKVRLGDVVISTPLGQSPGVIQWDMGKAREGGKFERTGALNNPPGALLTALTALEAQYDMEGSKVPGYLNELKQKWPKMAKKYLRSDSLKDVLFRTDYAHVSEAAVDHDANEVANGNDVEEVEDEVEEKTDEEDESCRYCDKNKVVKRKPRREMRLHYGLIASGNQVIKSATFRDKLKKDLGVDVLCVEMEAAGLMNNFPCVVIRGICDYADSHKNEAWQKHAAAVAAAVAKELLSHLQPSEVDGEPSVRDVLNECKQVRQCLQNVAKGVIETNQGLDNLRGEQELRKKNSILDWLSSINYSLQQTDYITQQEPGTAQWLLNSTEFRNWLEISEQTLFCPGIPGAGKTIQTSVVVQDLCTRFYNDNTVGIAYLYCNFQRQEDQKIENLLANLLKQLAKWRSPLPDSVIALYNRHQNRDTRPLREDISETLNLVALTYARVFIVVDALDECQESSRTRLLNELFRLQKKTGASLLATSRMIPEIENQFNGCLLLEIRPSKEDILHFLDRHLALLPDFVTKDIGFQIEIKTDIEAAIDGVFLLAKLYLESLVGKRSPTALRKTLKSLREASQASKDKSRALYGAYEKAMERIRLQLGDLARDATLTLSWIVHAKRRLEVQELQHALAVEIGTDELDNGNIPTAEHIIQACAPLVTIEKESNIIRLVHYTLQEFFEKEQNIWLPDAQAYITRVCVTYLSFRAFERGFCETDREFGERLKSHPFFNYAAHNWGHHARESLPLCQEAMDFLNCQTKVEASSQVLMAVKRYSWSSEDCQRVPRQMTGLHLAAYFGVRMAIDAMLIEHCSDPKDSYGRTPLSWAAENGHEAVVKMFLDKDADMESKDKDGRTPLRWAAERGHGAVVRLLLDKGADTESKDKNGRTPLSWAAEKGREAIVKALLDKGANTESKDKYDGRTPLSWAAINGHEAVVRLLLEKGAIADSKDNYHSRWAGDNGHKPGEGAGTELRYNEHRRTPLWWAAEGGHGAVVRLLLDKGADMESKNKDGRTPLWWAAERGREAIVRLLLQKGADLEFSSGEYINMQLLLAAEYGNEAVVKALLDNGADMKSKDKDGRTPLWWAAERGHGAVVRLLLNKRAGLDLGSGEYGNMQLLLAARYGNEALLKALLDKGANVESKDTKYGQTPLSWAAENGHEAIIKALLDKGANTESKDKYDGRTPLSWAATNGYETVVKALLDKDADMESKDKYYGQTPLSWAATNGHETVVKVLLDNSANLESKDKEYGRTPLSWAAKNGHETVVKVLLDNSANLESKDKEYGRTPLSWAAEMGHEAVIRLLLQKGADLEFSSGEYINMQLLLAAQYGNKAFLKAFLDKGADIESKDKDGRTPLWWAAERGREGVVKALLNKGANVESKDTKYGRTPLSWAAKNGHETVVKALLDNSANVESKDREYGQTPLSWAAGNGHEAVVKALLDKDADMESKDKYYGQTPLSWAATNGHETVVKALLDKDADMESKDKDGRTPLRWAAERGHGAVVRLLLDKGADMESKDKDGRTPLWWAAESGHGAVIRLLLNKGAGLDLRSGEYGNMQLLLAARYKNEALLKALLDKGANVESKDIKYSQTPLSWAAENGHEVIVKALLDKGANTESKDKYDGRTPLSWAATNGHEAVVRLLLENSADRESKDKDAWTPLWWAAENGHEVVVRLLLENRAEIKSKDKGGRTPLSWAARNGHKVIVKILLENGAEIEWKDEDGRTPLWWASQNGHKEVVKLLLDSAAERESINTKAGRPINHSATTLHARS